MVDFALGWLSTLNEEMQDMQGKTTSLEKKLEDLERATAALQALILRTQDSGPPLVSALTAANTIAEPAGLSEILFYMFISGVCTFILIFLIEIFLGLYFMALAKAEDNRENYRLVAEQAQNEIQEGSTLNTQPNNQASVGLSSSVSPEEEHDYQFRKLMLQHPGMFFRGIAFYGFVLAQKLAWSAAFVMNREMVALWNIFLAAIQKVKDALRIFGRVTMKRESDDEIFEDAMEGNGEEDHDAKTEGTPKEL